VRAVLVSFTLSPVLLRDWKVRTESQPSDRIAVISSAIAAFTSIANSITSSQREDIRSVAVLLYTGKTIFFCDQSSNLSSLHADLLKDETSEIDLVGPTFPALKALLNLPVAPGPDNKERYDRLIHALLSTCLRHIDGMR
jgi:hypothetical protein